MKKTVLFFLCLAACFPAGFSCTDFILFDQKGNAAIGRSMEFGVPLDSQIVLYPKGKSFESYVMQNQTGMSWVSRYAFIGITAFGLDIIVDGMNEKGLTIEALWFPGTKYPSVTSRDLKNIIALEDLGNWILSSFSTVEEVENALKNTQIWAHEISQIQRIPPLHFSLHDKSGKSIVVEFIEGKMEISGNTVGVLTNAPKFEWHVTNLRNYVNLTAIDAGSVDFSGTVLSPTGQGSGLLGIPGDWTPTSRFVRIAIFKQYMQKADSPEKNVYLAFHLLNTVDIPYGAIQTKNGKDFDYTQWVIVKDLSRNILYYRDYRDLKINMIDFSAEMLRLGSNIKKIPMKGTGL